MTTRDPVSFFIISHPQSMVGFLTLDAARDRAREFGQTFVILHCTEAEVFEAPVEEEPPAGGAS